MSEAMEEVNHMQGTAQASTAIEVTDDDFVEKVVEASRERPVVVDLWAAWCGPCKVIGPILERIAEERGGAFLLAKLDVDANPYTAGQFGVQSIPTVIAFRDGKAVDGFIGALPEPMVNEFVDRILPSEADLVAKEALVEAESGDTRGAEQRFQDALSADPGNREARLGLARIVAERGEKEEARELLAALLPDTEAEGLLATIRVSEWGEVEEAGTLASAKRLAAVGRWHEALDGMLASLGDDPSAREAMLDVFAVLGDEDPLTVEYRRRLSSALF